MIKGTGIDLIDVERVAYRVGRTEGFREMVFSAAEIEYCEARGNKYEHYAARYAAKEAFFKALGTGWVNDTAYHEVEVFNDEAGKPGIKLLGKTAETLSSWGTISIAVSLTHLKTMAAAVVIIESI